MAEGDNTVEEDPTIGPYGAKTNKKDADKHKNTLRAHCNALQRRTDDASTQATENCSASARPP